MVFTEKKKQTFVKLATGASSLNYVFEKDKHQTEEKNDLVDLFANHLDKCDEEAR